MHSEVLQKVKISKNWKDRMGESFLEWKVCRNLAQFLQEFCKNSVTHVKKCINVNYGIILELSLLEKNSKNNVPIQFNLYLFAAEGPPA